MLASSCDPFVFRRAALSLSLGAWLVYLSVFAPSLATWDGGGMLNASVSLIQRHDLSVPPSFGISGQDGKFYGIWYPLLSFVAVPFAWAGIVVARHTRLPEPYVVAVFGILLSTIIAALNVGATYYLARSRLGASKRRAIAAALCFAFGTLALRYSRSFYADPLLTLITTAILIAIFSEEPNALILAVLCALVILAKPVGLLVCVAALLYLIVGRKHTGAISVAVGSIVGVTLYALYDWIRFANVFTTGQPNFWSLREMPDGLPGLVISPGVGLLVCCPVVILAVRKRLSRESSLILSLTVAYVLLYSCWERWYASDWGPRFLMPMLPALIVLSALTKHRRLWLVLAAFGVLMQIPTALGFPERYGAVLSTKGISEEASVWHPSVSTTLGIWRSSFEQIRDARNEDIRQFATYRPTATNLSDARNFKIVPIWWWMLPLIHIPRIWGVIVSVFEITVGFSIIGHSATNEYPSPHALQVMQ